MLSLHTSPLAQPGAGDGGGMNVYVSSLASALARAGVECDVLTRAEHPDQQTVIEVEPGFRVVHLAAGPPTPVCKDTLVGLLDDCGTREAEDVVGAPEITRMGRELHAAVSRLVEPVALDHRPHRAVEDEDAAIEQLTKFGGTVRLCHSILQRKKKPRLKLRGISRSRTRSTAGSLAFFNLVASGPANQSRSGEVTAGSKPCQTWDLS